MYISFRKLVWIYSSSATFIWVLQYFHYPQCGKSALHKTFKLVPRLLKLWPCAQADIFYKRSGYTSNASTLLKNASCCCIVPGSSWVFPGSACPVWEGVSAHTYQSPVFGFWECLRYPWREWAGQKQRKGKVWKAGHFFVLHKETVVEMLRKVKWKSWHFKSSSRTCVFHVLWMNNVLIGITSFHSTMTLMWNW